MGKSKLQLSKEEQGIAFEHKKMGDILIMFNVTHVAFQKIF